MNTADTREHTSPESPLVVTLEGSLLYATSNSQDFSVLGGGYGEDKACTGDLV